MFKLGNSSCSTKAMSMMTAIHVFIFISATFYTVDVDSFSTLKHPHPMREIASGEGGVGPGSAAGAVPEPDHAPRVEIEIPGAPEHLTWNTQVRYIISVSDPKDGESRYGEIEARACLMEVEYFPAADEKKANELMKASKEKEEHKGLSAMKRSTCFGCHSDKVRLAGPSFEEMAGRYQNNAVTVKELGGRIVGGTSGIWGTQVMPSHPDLTLEEAAQIADYILQQGGNKNRWIYPGLEGTFRVIEKPENHDQGIYVLTASYTSTSNVRGQQCVVFKIR
jgi:cytochrome c